VDRVATDVSTSTTPTAPRTGLPVNWSLAASTGSRLVAAGPDVTPAQAAEEVSRLRDGARVGEQHVRTLTGLGAGLPVPDADVVDRPGWVRSAVDGMSVLLGDISVARAPAGAMGTALGSVTASASGVQMGALLAFLGARVLGQYDPFGGPDRAGRLLLVAPNVVAAREALDVDADDFALWVCLHEATHRLQFTAVPWLRDHIEGEIQEFLAQTEIDPATLLERVTKAAQSMVGGRNETDAEAESVSMLEVVQTPAQREILARLTAVMSLLEGHADFVMDGVGPDVVPSVAEIREKFQQRRASGAGRLDQALRRLLGLDAKLRQYRDGERFVRAVVNETGMDGFNRVWTSPNTLPTKAEIAKPADWITRVHRHTDS
jgi:coenzyme F420 biosynthesis associated uncharacterized protein